jgi:hypothetical protein
MLRSLNWELVTDITAQHISSRVKQSKKIFFHCLTFEDETDRLFRKVGIYHCVKKKQLDAQLILSIFRQPLHVSGVSRPIIRRYNNMYTTIGTYYSS